VGLLETRDLSLRLDGKPIIKNLTVDFWEGHVHAVIGPNGAGKSTLASTIMGLSGYRDFEGDILFEGESIKDADLDERARMGITLAWQEPARYEGLGMRQFLGAGMKEPGEDDIRDLLSKVGLDPDEYIDRAVDKTLSGGERKKVELASILGMRPRLVFLDEPDSGIDVESLNRIFDAIKILKAAGSTVILITHSLAVLKQAEHAFLLCGGELVEKGSVEKINSRFKDECGPCDHKNFPDKPGGGEG
jgi:Fe-S cluster assembly ATP-binding protein